MGKNLDPSVIRRAEERSNLEKNGLAAQWAAEADEQGLVWYAVIGKSNGEEYLMRYGAALASVGESVYVIAAHYDGGEDVAYIESECVLDVVDGILTMKDYVLPPNKMLETAASMRHWSLNPLRGLVGDLSFTDIPSKSPDPRDQTVVFDLENARFAVVPVTTRELERRYDAYWLWARDEADAAQSKLGVH